MKILLSLLFLFISILTSKATHFFATNLSYECLGNNQYKVTLHLYSDCSGTPPPATADIQLSSSSCGQTSSTIVLNMDIVASGAEITPLCATYASLSSCKGGSIPAEQETIYTGIITLNQSCPDWVISHSYARSSYFTNINNPGGTFTYIEATLDNSTGACYNSPQFTDYPMYYACAGTAYEGNLGVRDLDGDTLLYTLMTPATSASSQASFVAGLTVNNPMQLAAGSSFNFNNYTGDFSFIPQGGSSQFAVLAVKVDKIHNGNVVASSMQEMDFSITTSCNNPSIQLLANTISMGMYSNDSTKSITVCNSTNPVAMSFELFNPNGDSILYYAKQSNLESIFGSGNFTITMNYLNNRPDSAQLDILATNFTAASPQFLSVAVRNKGCIMESHRKFTYLLKPLVQLSIQSTSASSATSNDGSAVVTASGGQANYSYAWSNGSTNNSSNNLLPDIYTVTVTDANNCSTVDSVNISFLTTVQTIEQAHNVMLLYPNPSSDYCMVRLPNLQGHMVHLELINHLGQVLTQKTVILNGQKEFKLDIQDYPKGLYWIKLYSEKKEHRVTTLRIK